MHTFLCANFQQAATYFFQHSEYINLQDSRYQSFKKYLYSNMKNRKSEKLFYTCA